MLTIGQVIRNLRKEQNITQEKLVEGICTASYLSRIEKGESKISEDTAHALLERLGSDLTKYINFKSENELKIAQLKYDIRKYTATNKVELHREKLEELIDLSKTTSVSHDQFIMLHKYISLYKDEYDEKLEHVLYDALRLTKPKIDLEAIKNELLTQDELIILINIATMLKHKGDLDLSIKILKDIIAYLDESRIEVTIKRRSYGIAMFNLLSFMSETDSYYETLGYCDKAIDYCINHNVLNILAGCYFYKGRTLYKLDIKKESMDCLMQAYYLAKSTKDSEVLDLTKKYLVEDFQIYDKKIENILD